MPRVDFKRRPRSIQPRQHLTRYLIYRDVPSYNARRKTCGKKSQNDNRYFYAFLLHTLALSLTTFPTTPTMTYIRLCDSCADGFKRYASPPVDAIPQADVGFYATHCDADGLAICYANGFFPWPTHDLPLIPFYCPRERFVLRPEHLHISHSLKRTLARNPFVIRCDTAFDDVVRQCASAYRPGQCGTWITEDYADAMLSLHERGIAHSIEAYDENGRLCGGFYGTCIGRIFGGESMFTNVSDSSKVAFAIFVRRARDFGIQLIDCQDYTSNMRRFGATMIPRKTFLNALITQRDNPVDPDMWRF